MGIEEERSRAAAESTGAEDFPRGEGEPGEDEGRLSPSWRGLMLSVVAAIILSVTATLLLGGVFLPKGAGTAGGCPNGVSCSLPAEER